MTGVVTVTDGYKIIPDVGKDVGDGLTLFNVDYQYSGVISDPMINENNKSITFLISNDPKSHDYNLILLLPSRITSYNVCYTKLLRLFYSHLSLSQPRSSKDESNKNKGTCLFL